MQDGKIYNANGRVALPAGSSWASFSITLTDVDYTGIGNPDFSPSGSPIHFGFQTQNTSLNTVQKTTVTHIDNYEVIITLDEPEISLDHYLLYEAKVTKDTPKFEKLTVSLADQFDDGDGAAQDFEIERVERLGNPADKNGEGISDPNTHIVGYKIKRAKDELEHMQLTGVVVTNQFGEIILDTDKPDRLLVPSLKDLVDPIPDGDVPGSFPVDHFKCYKVKVTEDTPEFEQLEVSVADQFSPGMLYTVEKPERLCNPVDKNNEGVIDPDGHLLCYKVAVAGIHINNQFGPLELNTKFAKELCVPSEKDISGAVPLD